MSVSKILPSCIELPLEPEVLNEIVTKAKDYALSHGISMRSKASYDPDSLSFAPFVLTPSVYPKDEFVKATKLQTVLNKLMHHIAFDYEFLKETLASTIKVDTFTNELFQIYETVRAEHSGQEISLGLIRSDTMLESSDAQKNCITGRCQDAAKKHFYCCVGMVEINTIASGFGHLGPSSARLQSYILKELGHEDKVENLPENNALGGLCDAMCEAWKIIDNPKASILFVIEDVTYNICDQRFHEFYIREHYPHIRVVRKTLTQIHKEGKLGPNGELLIGGIQMSVVYFRAGYEPGHYHSRNEWDARLLMERSAAIKSPSIHYHLAGTKKVQQALAMNGVLERFLTDKEEIRRVKEIFTGLYSLDKDEGGDEAVAMALKNPEGFVMKPQREGGGNNIYGADIPPVLANMPETERSAYILMERISPPISRSYMVRPGGPIPPPIVDMVSELGIFGAIIGNKDEIFYNKQVGHMLRTKVSSADEGGVAAGLGALDSVFLTNDF